MLKEEQLFTLLDKVLKQTAFIRKGEEAVYFCPFCTHYKKKLEINVRTQDWHCWVCHARGTTIKSFFYKLKVKESYVTELYKIIGDTVIRKTRNVDVPVDLSLPEEFIPLSTQSLSMDYGIAMSYLAKRNITMDDILRYNLGFCEKGIYSGRIMIPSYDKNANINFFSARTYSDNAYKYMLAPWPKNIVGFELFINWDEPITIVEGGFDAIAVKNNSIPLFGTTLTFGLKLAIITNKVKRVNIILDNDALKQSIDIFDRIEEMRVDDIDIHLIKLGDKDPSVLGFEQMNEIIRKSKSFDFSDIIRTRLELKR